jgi:uncharacterized protein YjbI with pentapeptide repeats
MRLIQVTWILCVVLNIWLGLVSGWAEQTPSAADQLLKAQIENQHAQATYYHSQADKRGFWRNLREYGGPVGAAVAAVVAIIALGQAYIATLGNRADTRFYEALNLFSDAKNPGVRSGAASLLEQMGSTGKRYYQTAFDQLAIGLLGERDEFARTAIRAALERLVALDPAAALPKLQSINRSLGSAMAESFCRTCAARGIESIEQVHDAIWQEVEEATGYDRDAITGLLQILPRDSVIAGFTTAARARRLAGKKDFDDDECRTRAELSESAERLRSNINSISEVLLLLEANRTSRDASSGRSKVVQLFSFAFLVGIKFSDLIDGKIRCSILREGKFAGAILTRAVLVDTDLSSADLGSAKLCQVKCSGTKLVGANLRDADLTGAEFKNCDLSDADLTGARFRNTSIAPAALEHTEWWKADFKYQQGLLREVHAMYKENLPDLTSLYVHGEIHQSVLDLIGKITEERL